MLACVVFFTTAQKSWLVNGFFPIVENILFRKNSRGSPYCVKYRDYKKYETKEVKFLNCLIRPKKKPKGTSSNYGTTLQAINIVEDMLTTNCFIHFIMIF